MSVADTAWSHGTHLGKIADELEGRIADGSLDVELLDNGCAAVERLARLMLLQGFQAAGVFTQEGETFTVGELAGRLHIVTDYKRLFQVLLEMLEREGVLSIEGDRVTVSELRDASPKACSARKTEVLEAFPDRAILVRLVESCASESLAVAAGRKNAVEVLFPGGSASLVQDVYTHDVVSQFFNRLVSHAVQGFVASVLTQHPGRKVSVLEIGAGTGGTSASVLGAIRTVGHRVSYDYTDISSSLLHEASSRFGDDHPHVHFRPLDIETDPEGQGFRRGSVDVALAANVLHATRDTAATLRNVRKLVRAGGVVIVNEVTRVFDFTTLTFGLTPGWWLFEDPEARLPNSPLLSDAGWRRALAESGFDPVHSFTPFDREPAGPAQTLLIAVRDGGEPAHDDGAERIDAMRRALREAAGGSAEVRRLVERQTEIIERQLQLLRERRKR